MPTIEGITFLDKPTRVDAGTHNGARNKPNEDRYATFTGPGDNGRPVQFLAVADGVTSTHGGERASDIAVRVLQQTLQTPTQTAGRAAPKSLRDRLADAIHRANQEILETARKDPDLKGMSTTLVVAAVDGDQLIVMHVGDSRAYLIRNGKAHQLTRDHTWVQDALEEGRITREQAANHPNRHVILRYLGDARGISIDQGILDPDKPAVDIDETEVGRQQQARANDTTLTLRPGDALLLCSDGLYGRITDGEMAAAVTKFAPEKAVKSMIDEAVKRDEPDNITIVLWTTASAAPVAGVATTSRRPALLLAAAGALLVLLAAFIFMRPGAAPEQVAVSTESAGQVTAAGVVTTTEVATAIPTEAPPTETSTTTEIPTATPEATPVPTETPALATPADNANGNLVNVEQASQVSDTMPLTETISNSLTTGIADVVGTLEGPSNPTSTAANPTRTPIPTSTPMMTSTPRPTTTPTPTPTRSLPTPSTVSGVATAAAPAVADSAVGGPTSAQIIQPGDNHSSNVATLFKWVADAPLAPGQEFEIVFWKANGESEVQARGILHSSIATETMQPVNTLSPDAYKWALVLVQTEPSYRRLRTLAGPFNFTVPGISEPEPWDGYDGRGTEKRG